MVRKKKTEHHSSGAESSESQESGGGGGRGPQRPSASPQQGGSGGHHAGAGRAWGPQSQQGGRGGYGGGRGRGPQPQQQYYGGPSEYQGRGRGASPQQGGRGGYAPGRGSAGMGGGGTGGGRGGPSFGGQPRSSPIPELYQAQPVSYPSGVTPQASSSEAGSSSQIVEQLEDLNIRGTSQSAAQSSKSMRFPLRPGKGSTGQRCIVKANHFFAELPDKDLHQYDVTITPEVTSRGVNRAVMEQLVKQHRESLLGKRLPAYDGRKSLYTAGPLPFISKEFRITLLDEDDGQGGQRREREFRVVIKLAARADLHHLGLFLQGRQADAPQEALQVLDIVLRELPTTRYCPVGRSFYSPDLGRRQPLGEGLESWRGFYQSIRPTQMGLSLNIGIHWCPSMVQVYVLLFGAFM